MKLFDDLEGGFKGYVQYQKTSGEHFNEFLSKHKKELKTWTGKNAVLEETPINGLQLTFGEKSCRRFTFIE